VRCPHGINDAKIPAGMAKSDIETYLRSLPTKPGIYLFKDSNETVIYVGKASNLRNRVKSYFQQASNFPDKTQQLISKVDKIEFVVTESDVAALILECQQIKKYRPRYNVLLKDDKSFPYIKIDVKNEWPTINITRRRYDDGAKYIGRIPSAASARQTYELIKKLFPLRSCSRVITGKDIRPCLKYHIRRCYGPCIGAISKEEYRDIVKQAITFLEGKENYVLRELKRKMNVASENMEFEKAAQIRDQIQAINDVIESHKIPFNIKGEHDIVALARDYDLACLRMFSVKDGKLINDKQYIMEGTHNEENSQIMESFVKQYYSAAVDMPGVIVLQFPVIEPDLITRWLQEKRGAHVELRVPSKGTLLRLVEMVAENARQELAMYQVRQTARPEILTVLSKLKDRLNFPKIPHRIEAYDISNIQGTTAVGSMVVFENASPRPAHYRRFKIKSVQNIDDYAMMREVIQRRFRGYVDSQENWTVAPDLVLVDGGKGQLNAAVKGMDEMGVTNIPVISLAKENEDIYLTGSTEPIRIDKSSPELHLLQRIRDEAHRFAVTYHRKLRSKRGKESALDTIPGIGPARKKALIKKFGSVRNIRDATIEQLSSVEGITAGLAKRILESLP
jgi:excinuclease ABC subunit C